MDIVRRILTLVTIETKRVNRSFLSWPKPLFQNKAKCKAIDIKIIFYSHANETHFHKKSILVSLVLKVKV